MSRERRVPQNVSIALLQAGASDDQALLAVRDVVQSIVADRFQPGYPVLVRQRMAGRHLVNVALRMELRILI